MSRGGPQQRPRGSWTREEVAREEAARRARVAEAAASGPSANLERAAALNRFARRFAAAFKREAR